MTFREAAIAYIIENPKLKDHMRGLRGRFLNRATFYGSLFYMSNAVDESKGYNESKSVLLDKLSSLSEYAFTSLSKWWR